MFFIICMTSGYTCYERAEGRKKEASKVMYIQVTHLRIFVCDSRFMSCISDSICRLNFLFLFIFSTITSPVFLWVTWKEGWREEGGERGRRGERKEGGERGRREGREEGGRGERKEGREEGGERKEGGETGRRGGGERGWKEGGERGRREGREEEEGQHLSDHYIYAAQRTWPACDITNSILFN